MRPIGIRMRILLAALVLSLGQICAEAAPDDIEQAPVQNQANRQFFMNDANLDANIFNQQGNAAQARTRLESKLKLQLDELHRICHLSDSQRQKLMLAASSDMKRFFDEVDAVRKKYRAGKQDQEAWQNIWQEIQPLQMKMSSGLFGEGSFFAKTIRKTLTDEQFANYDALIGERRRFRYHAVIEVAITSMENSVPLRPEQHAAIVKLLLDETQPPTVFGQYDQQVVMHHLAKLPEDKLKPLLDERQWKLIQNQMNQGRGMEQFLIQNGVIPKEAAIAKKLKMRVIRPAARPNTPADAGQPENQPKTAGRED